MSDSTAKTRAIVTTRLNSPQRQRTIAAVDADVRVDPGLMAELKNEGTLDDLILLAENDSDNSVRREALRLLSSVEIGADRCDRLITLLRREAHNRVSNVLGEAVAAVWGQDRTGVFRRRDRNLLLGELLSLDVPEHARVTAIRELARYGEIDALERVVMLPVSSAEVRDAVLALTTAIIGRKRRVDRLRSSSFEHLVLYILLKEHPTLCGDVRGRRRDRGIDIVLYEPPHVQLGQYPSRGIRFVAQCKRWKHTRVPASEVSEFMAIAKSRGAGAVFVTTSDFTDETYDMERGRDSEGALLSPRLSVPELTLIARSRLRDLLDRHGLAETYEL
ncbi:MAG: restriction endonuclease [Deltaproteobacteria bacterium]|nr:restriction endonuclease [Deltaproteobacteria bacterium]